MPVPHIAGGKLSRHSLNLGSPRALPPRSCSHLLATLWIPEQLCFGDRQVAEVAVAVAAASV